MTTTKNIARGTHVTKFGKEFAIDSVIKDHIFPVIKFAKFHTDLKFSNKQTSICRLFVEKLSIPTDELDDWSWDCQRRPVDNKLKWNNTIKATKKLYQGKRTGATEQPEVDNKNTKEGRITADTNTAKRLRVSCESGRRSTIMSVAQACICCHTSNTAWTQYSTNSSSVQHTLLTHQQISENSLTTSQ